MCVKKEYSTIVIKGEQLDILLLNGKLQLEHYRKMNTLSRGRKPEYFNIKEYVRKKNILTSPISIFTLYRMTLSVRKM